jgi:hypothetical protein
MFDGGINKIGFSTAGILFMEQPEHIEGDTVEVDGFPRVPLHARRLRAFLDISWHEALPFGKSECSLITQHLTYNYFDVPV